MTFNHISVNRVNFYQVQRIKAIKFFFFFLRQQLFTVKLKFGKQEISLENEKNIFFKFYFSRSELEVSHNKLIRFYKILIKIQKIKLFQKFLWNWLYDPIKRCENSTKCRRIKIVHQNHKNFKLFPKFSFLKWKRKSFWT